MTATKKKTLVKRYALSLRGQTSFSKMIAGLVGLAMVAVGVYVIGFGHAASIPQPQGSSTSDWGLTFYDEFNGTSLDTTKWTPTWTSGDGGLSNESTMLAANTTVSGGYLHLKTGNANGSIVNSDPNYGPKPGEMITPGSSPYFIEWRASVPGSGNQNYNWPALWLSSENWPANGEIDAYEGFGNTTSHLEYGTCCGAAPAFNNPGTGNVGGPELPWTPGFHTWGVLYSPTSVTVYYDGQVESVYNNATLGNSVYALLSTSPPNSIKGPMMLIMENAYAKNKASNTDMQVDYVRVWQQGAASIAYTGPDGGSASTPTPSITPTSGSQISQIGNLAAGRTFSSSVGNSTTEPGNPPTNVNDGDESTRWISAPADGVTLTTDLGGRYALDKVSVLWAGDTVKDYVLEASEDQVTWKTIASGTTDNTPRQLIDTPVSGSGRYFRIVGTDRWNTAYGNSIWEVGIYGTAATAPAASVGDMTGDGHVDVFDLSYLLGKWGSADAKADLDHNAHVDVFDLSALLAHWTG